jgi:hypothetical protein
MFPYQKEKESTRLLREAFEERMRTEHPFTAEQLQQFDDLKALLVRVPKLRKANKMKAEEAAKGEICARRSLTSKERSRKKGDSALYKSATNHPRTFKIQLILL